MEQARISEPGGFGLIKCIAFSFLITLAFGAVLLTATAFILTKCEDPSSLIHLVGIALPAVTAFFGGIVAGKTNKPMGALSGTICGACFIGSLFLLSFFLGEGSFTAWQTLLFYAVLLLLSLLGGFLGASKRNARKRRRRTHR